MARARMEATYAGTSVSTQVNLFCHNGQPATNTVAVTNRSYAVRIGPDPDQPLSMHSMEYALHSTNLIAWSAQTNTWLQPDGTPTSEVYVLYREDNLSVVTNVEIITVYTPSWTQYLGCVVSTNDLTEFMWTNMPPGYFRMDFMGAVDSAINQLMSSGLWLDWTKASNGTFEAWMNRETAITQATWAWDKWTVTTSMVRVATLPFLTIPRIWEISGVGTIRTNLTIVDYGTNFPHAVTNMVDGWTLGRMDVWKVAATGIAPRYAITTNLTCLYSHSTTISNAVMGELASGRDWNAMEARGFGGGIDGLLTPQLVEDDPFGGVYDYSAIVSAMSNAGWNLVQPTEDMQAPAGCWVNTNTTPASVAEVAGAAEWHYASGYSWLGGKTMPMIKPSLRVECLATSEWACVDGDPTPIPSPIDVTIVGTYFTEAEPGLATTQQTIRISAPGSYLLDVPFLSIASITATNAIWHSSVYYPKGGIHLSVATPVAMDNYLNAIPRWQWTKPLEERKAVLQTLKWTAAAGVPTGPEQLLASTASGIVTGTLDGVGFTNSAGFKECTTIATCSVERAEARLYPVTNSAASGWPLGAFRRMTVRDANTTYVISERRAFYNEYGVFLEEHINTYTSCQPPPPDVPLVIDPFAEISVEITYTILDTFSGACDANNTCGAGAVTGRWFRTTTVDWSGVTNCSKAGVHSNIVSITTNAADTGVLPASTYFCDGGHIVEVLREWLVPSDYPMITNRLDGELYNYGPWTNFYGNAVTLDFFRRGADIVYPRKTERVACFVDEYFHGGELCDTNAQWTLDASLPPLMRAGWITQPANGATSVLTNRQFNIGGIPWPAQTTTGMTWSVDSAFEVRKFNF